jgi:hypothetical protein
MENIMGKRGPMPLKGDARKRLGDVSITKGSTPEGIPIVQWDSIQECEQERCNIFSSCPYEKHGKCGVRKEYINYVYRHFVGCVDGNDKMALFKIGLAVVPLFSHLVTMKIACHGLPATYFDEKGGVKVNPLFREIRETIRAISSVVNEMKESFDTLRKKEDVLTCGSGDDLLGNSSYYDQLFCGEAPKVERTMRNRV